MPNETTATTRITSPDSAAPSELHPNGERNFRELFDHSPDAIFVEDMHGYVLDVNPAACVLHDMTRTELIGKHVTELVPHDQEAMVRESFPRLARGELERLEGYSYTRSGQAIPVEIKVNQITYQGSQRYSCTSAIPQRGGPRRKLCSAAKQPTAPC